MTDHNSAHGTYTSTPAAKPAAPTNIVDAFKQDASLNDPIKRAVGETKTFDKGRDYTPARARIITSMFKAATDDEKAFYVSQGNGAGISVSLQTLKDIVAWAESEPVSGG